MTKAVTSKEKRVDLSSDIRQQMSELMMSELAKLPDLLEQIEPEKRIGLIIKMMPFVMPRVEKATLSQLFPDPNLMW